MPPPLFPCCSPGYPSWQLRACVCLCVCVCVCLLRVNRSGLRHAQCVLYTVADPGRGHKEVRKSTGHMMLTTRYSNQLQIATKSLPGPATRDHREVIRVKTMSWVRTKVSTIWNASSISESELQFTEKMLKKKLNASKPSEHPPSRGKCQKVWVGTLTDVLPICQSHQK